MDEQLKFHLSEIARILNVKTKIALIYESEDLVEISDFVMVEAETPKVEDDVPLEEPQIKDEIVEVEHSRDMKVEILDKIIEDYRPNIKENVIEPKCASDFH